MMMYKSGVKDILKKRMLHSMKVSSLYYIE